jgi:hypothetical protein
VMTVSSVSIVSTRWTKDGVISVIPVRGVSTIGAAHSVTWVST